MSRSLFHRPRQQSRTHMRYALVMTEFSKAHYLIEIQVFFPSSARFVSSSTRTSPELLYTQCYYIRMNGIPNNKIIIILCQLHPVRQSVGRRHGIMVCAYKINRNNTYLLLYRRGKCREIIEKSIAHKPILYIIIIINMNQSQAV